jgi:KUP system potassium uptake protein
MANLTKIKDGGWITLVIGSVLLLVMIVWREGRAVKNKFSPYITLQPQIDNLIRLSSDEKIQKTSTHLVYLTRSSTPKKIEKTIIDSIMKGMPKRADIYWFIHVNVMDEPYALQYNLHTVVPNDIYVLHLELGFRIEPRVEYYFRQIVVEMIEKREIDLSGRFEHCYQSEQVGDIKFVVMDSFLSFENDMPVWRNFIMKSYYNLRKISVKDYINFGLDQSAVLNEKYPLIVTPVEAKKIIRSAEV